MNDFVWRPSISITEFLDPRLLVETLRLQMFSSQRTHVQSHFTNETLVKLMEVRPAPLCCLAACLAACLATCLLLACCMLPVCCLPAACMLHAACLTLHPSIHLTTGSCVLCSGRCCSSAALLQTSQRWTR